MCSWGKPNNIGTDDIVTVQPFILIDLFSIQEHPVFSIFGILSGLAVKGNLLEVFGRTMITGLGIL